MALMMTMTIMTTATKKYFYIAFKWINFLKFNKIIKLCNFSQSLILATLLFSCHNTVIWRRYKDDCGVIKRSRIFKPPFTVSI